MWGVHLKKLSPGHLSHGKYQMPFSDEVKHRSSEVVNQAFSSIGLMLLCLLENQLASQFGWLALPVTLDFLSLFQRAVTSDFV